MFTLFFPEAVLALLHGQHSAPNARDTKIVSVSETSLFTVLLQIKFDRFKTLEVSTPNSLARIRLQASSLICLWSGYSVDIWALLVDDKEGCGLYKKLFPSLSSSWLSCVSQDLHGPLISTAA
jgi:hypothetical protein